jgi:SAM-dependent methyltransferase
MRDLLAGRQFASRQLYGVVEADFFDWPAAIAGGAPVVAGIARRLSKLDWSEVQHDVLKELYESVIDVETRHKLGEYYTPDWLAQRMVDEVVTDPLEQRVLDPACGSGTFLFWAVRRVLARCDEAGMTNQEALNVVVRQVQGIDLHPVAVTLARVTYLLAVTPDRLASRRDEIAIPVFLADSLRWEQDETVRMHADGLTVRTTDQLELFDRDLHFPEGVLKQPARFDRLVAALAQKAASRSTTAIPKIGGLLNRHKVEDEQDRAAIELVFGKLCHLHDSGRDHLWSYYIRNLARPLAFARKRGRADVLVGNPPWLAYRSMPVKLQETYRKLAGERGLWTGRTVATNQDLSDLFVVRAVEQYLATGGVFSFVMPFGVLSRRQFAGFRTGEWSNGDVGACAHLFRAHDFARVKPTPFPMPCCVITGRKDDKSTELPSAANVWRGRIPRGDPDWLAVSEHLTSEEENVVAAADTDASPYRSRFAQGATLLPRMLLTVEAANVGRLGVAAGRVPVRSARSSNEKRPWKDLDRLEGVVEEHFVRPMHAGSTIVAFRARRPKLAIVPWIDGRLADGENERIDEFPGLAAWWRRAEELWAAHRAPATALTLPEQVDFRGKLTRQFPLAQHRVVYSASGQHLAACRLEDTNAVIDKSLYWAAADTVAEARYLSAVLNSSVLAEAVVGLQARGQHNPRHFDMHVFELPFPNFNAGDEVHQRLAHLAARAETVTATLAFDETRQFQLARRAAREALKQDGVAALIDDTVAELLQPTPDLMQVFGRRQARARRRGTPEAVEPSPALPHESRLSR